MKLIIAGSRDIKDPLAVIERAIAHFGITGVTTVVSGAARGIDQAGEDWARKNGLSIVLFPAQWQTHGKAAGPIRNRKMAEHATALLAIWDGSSRGTKSMIEIATELGLKVWVYRVEAVE